MWWHVYSLKYSKALHLFSSILSYLSSCLKPTRRIAHSAGGSTGHSGSVQDECPGDIWLLNLGLLCYINYVNYVRTYLKSSVCKLHKKTGPGLEINDLKGLKVIGPNESNTLMLICKNIFLVHVSFAFLVCFHYKRSLCVIQECWRDCACLYRQR